jgi:hypothetical protein
MACRGTFFLPNDDMDWFPVRESEVQKTWRWFILRVGGNAVTRFEDATDCNRGDGSLEHPFDCVTGKVELGALHSLPVCRNHCLAPFSNWEYLYHYFRNSASMYAGLARVAGVIGLELAVTEARGGVVKSPRGAARPSPLFLATTAAPPITYVPPTIHIFGPKASLFHGPDGVKGGIHDGQCSPVESLDMVRSAEPDWDSDPPSSLTERYLNDHPSGGGARPCLARHATIPRAAFAALRISAGSRMTAIIDMRPPRMGQARTSTSYTFASRRRSRSSQRYAPKQQGSFLGA